MDQKFQGLERRISPDNAHCFFGYFDKFAENSGGIHLAHRVPFAGRQPRWNEEAEIGTLENGVFLPRAVTRAWCWQQGAMLQWFDESRFLYNDIEGDHYVSRLSDGTTYSLPVYALSPDRNFALSLNFARLDRERPGYGYPGLPDPYENLAFPEEDGITLMNLRTGEKMLIVSLADLVNRFPAAGGDLAMNWVNHLLFSPDGKHISFLHRWRVFGPWGRGVRSYVTRMFTCRTDGSDLRMLSIDFHASHYTWMSPEKLIVFARHPKGGDQYRIYTLNKNGSEIFAPGRLPDNGHCSFSPDGRLLLTDSYPDENAMRELVVYDPAKDARYSLGFFHSPGIPQPTRCDLHPRWSPDGRSISFDSFHEKFRGIYRIGLPEELLC